MLIFRGCLYFDFPKNIRDAPLRNPTAPKLSGDSPSEDHTRRTSEGVPAWSPRGCLVSTTIARRASLVLSRHEQNLSELSWVFYFGESNRWLFDAAVVFCFDDMVAKNILNMSSCCRLAITCAENVKLPRLFVCVCVCVCQVLDLLSSDEACTQSGCLSREVTLSNLQKTKTNMSLHHPTSSYYITTSIKGTNSVMFHWMMEQYGWGNL